MAEALLLDVTAALLDWEVWLIGGEAVSGTSRLERTAGFLSFVGLDDGRMGNRVASIGPLLRSRRWLPPAARPFACGAGLGARLRLAMALLRASMASRRCDSSVLMPRTRASCVPDLAPEAVCVRALARLSSPKMASLWAKRSRISR